MTHQIAVADPGEIVRTGLRRWAAMSSVKQVQNENVAAALVLVANAMTGLYDCIVVWTL